MSNDRILSLAALAAGLAALVLAVALLAAIIALGSQLASTWLLLATQISAATTMAVGATAAVAKLANTTSKQLEEIKRRHAEDMAALRKRTPALIAATVLLAQVVVVIADKTFDGKAPETVAVTLVLMVWFYLANESLTRLPERYRFLGYAFWCIGVLALPFFAWMHREFSFEALIRDVLTLKVEYQAAIAICIVVFMIAPFLCNYDA